MRKFLFRLKVVFIPISMFTFSSVANTDFVEFNTDILDVEDRKNFDLKQFSQNHYILPGDYTFTVLLNKASLGEHRISYTQLTGEANSAVCLSQEIVGLFGLKEEFTDALRWQSDGCLDLSSLSGLTVAGDLSNSTLNINLPQAYLQYNADNWDPPARWDQGINGLLFDYSLYVQSLSSQHGSRTNSMQGNGTTGVNLGQWRLRADWQAQKDLGQSGSRGQQTLDWNRYYAYRPVTSLGAKMTLGEDYLYSSLFDSFRYFGGSLVTDDNMLPPALRGYAPEINGVASANATVTVSQQGRVIYETQVAAGPFRIQDLSSSITGTLDVLVKEEGGTEQRFQVSTANVPYLSRPGTVRYKVVTGRPTDWEHDANGPLFSAGEFSWGVSNGWSLYGGGILSEEYQSLAAGLGRDLYALGALSADVTHSVATLPEKGKSGGSSYRLSYAKSFDEYNSQISFAGYRFSEKEFMSMNEFLSARRVGEHNYNSKERYTLTFNKRFTEPSVSLYLSYNRNSYWERPDSESYELTVVNSFDLNNWKRINVSLSGYRRQYDWRKDDGVYLNVSLPWGNKGSISYNASSRGGELRHAARYSGQIDAKNRYQLAAEISSQRSGFSGYASHLGERAEMNISTTAYTGNQYSATASVRGGLTATAKGAALHPAGIPGGTRLLVDTGGVAGVPVKGYGSGTRTNRAGKAVIADVSSYYRTEASIVLDDLDDNIEATQSVAQATLTEGAIGYRQFAVVAGKKGMANIRLRDGSAVPFGATVKNHQGHNTGMVADSGQTWLSGMNGGERMTVQWGKDKQCEFTLPDLLPENATNGLLLVCNEVASS